MPATNPELRRFRVIFIIVGVLALLILIGGIFAACQTSSGPEPTSAGAPESTATPSPDESTSSPSPSESATDPETSASPSDDETGGPFESVAYNVDPSDDSRPLGATKPKDHCWTDEQALAEEAARVMTTWNAADDWNTADAEVRAKYLMHPDRAENVGVPQRPAGTAWNQPAEHEAITLTETEPSTHHDASSIEMEVTWRWVSQDGWKGSAGSRFWAITTAEDPDDADCLVVNDYTWSGT
ncbi:hypothetical protein [Nesterenkonia halobia]|uniref:Uncharacterized protein n=1 Tax=Nesterenkonia halobia TaxID=37922 RepID=A0ABP6R9P0_9MICC